MLKRQACCFNRWLKLVRPLVKQLGCCMDMKPLTYGECIISITASSHSVSIFTRAHMGAHTTYCTRHTFTQFEKRTHPHAQRPTVFCCSEMRSFEVHAMWCTFRLPPLHSSMDFPAVSNTHTPHSLTLNSHFTRIINSVFQFHNAPQKCKQSSVQGLKMTYCIFFFWGGG